MQNALNANELFEHAIVRNVLTHAEVSKPRCNIVPHQATMGMHKKIAERPH